MSGRRIDDHSSWMGGPGKDSVLPDGPHKTKSQMSAEGAGAVKMYEDTSEAVKSQQDKGIGQAKRRPLKAGYRN